jgi:hypothetical protein
VNRRHPGVDGWLAVAAVVLAAEALDEKTMSSAFKSLPLPVRLTCWGIATAHLFGLLPEQADPFMWASKLPIPRRTRVS